MHLYAVPRSTMYRCALVYIVLVTCIAGTLSSGTGATQQSIYSDKTPECTAAMKAIDETRVSDGVSCELLLDMYNIVETGACETLYREAASTYKLIRRRVCEKSAELECADVYNCRAVALM